MGAEWLLVIGTLALAATALFQDFIRAWFNTPKLQVHTASDPPYCKKLLFNHPNDTEISAQGYGLRIAVRNTTPDFRINNSANGVEIFATKLEKEEAGNLREVPGFDPSALLWSDTFTPTTRLSPGMERYCYVGRVLKPGQRKGFPNFDHPTLPNDKTCLKLDTFVSRNTKEHILAPGIYRLECLIGATKVKAEKKVFEITLSGDWYDDEEEMYQKGLTIKMLD